MVKKKKKESEGGMEKGSNELNTYVEKKLVRKQSRLQTTSLKPCRHQSCGF